MNSTMNLVKRHFNMLFESPFLILLTLVLWFSYSLTFPHLLSLATFYIILYFTLLPTMEDFKSNIILVPIKRSEFVVSRYIYNFISSILIILITSITINISYGLNTDAGKLSFLLNATIPLISLAIFTPLTFRFRFQPHVASIAIGITVFFSSLSGTYINEIEHGFRALPFDINFLSIILLLLCFSILYFISMKISIKLFEKRELDLWIL